MYTLEKQKQSKLNVTRYPKVQLQIAVASPTVAGSECIPKTFRVQKKKVHYSGAVSCRMCHRAAEMNNFHHFPFHTGQGLSRRASDT